MGIEALTRDLKGHLVCPEDGGAWNDWVSATATRNHALNDPLLDWLDLYGESHGFLRDEAYPDYDARTDFSLFIMNKGVEFEAAVAQHLASLIPFYTIGKADESSRSLAASEDTFASMERGEPAIYQAVLRDTQFQTYGTADLLIRSDYLHQLFPAAITPEEVAVPAPDLGDVHSVDNTSPQQRISDPIIYSAIRKLSQQQR